MKIAFFSNYLTHHQLPLCRAFLNIENVEFVFVAFEAISSERIQLGYKDMNQEDFVIRAYEGQEQKDKALRICLEYDVLIIGSAPEEYISKRLEKNLLTFRYSERIFKRGVYRRFFPNTLKNLHRFHIRHKRKPLYLLCSSAFAAKDFARCGVYINKAYRWGYFPEIKKHSSIDSLISEKEPNSILWVGRLIDWKHPDDVIKIARRLKNDGYPFKIKMIGTGELREDIQAQISENGLQDEVALLDSMSPEQVRQYMEKSEIYLFTSDKNEGWGAVLNESMNSGCAVVASHIIGAVPFLVENMENGLIYKNGNIDDMYNKVRFLLDNPQKRAAFGKKAYLTVAEQWNAENAAKRFVKLVSEISGGNKAADVFSDGVCSRAPIISDNWYK